MNAADDMLSLYAQLPHGGQMCLLDAVLDWDAEAIRCLTRSHQDPTNPLRGDDGLAAVHGVEYGAQAAALHGVLTGAIDGGPGLMLGAVRDLLLPVDRLDRVAEPLVISARLELRSGPNAIYAIGIAAVGRDLMTGRLTLLRADGGEP